MLARVTCLHAIAALVFWLTNLGFSGEVNRFLADLTGVQANFLLIFLACSAGVGLWGAQRHLRGRARRTRRLFGSTAFLYLALFYGSFAVLFMKNPIQVPRLLQWIQYFRLFWDGLALIALATGLRRLLQHTHPTWMKAAAVACLALAWLAPFCWTPGNVAPVRGIPAKPVLIAHRGASAIAPENTMAAMRQAVALGAYGLETDVAVSLDGILFLMHDASLARTTNIALIYPERADERADTFTWPELSRLDAGAWFVADGQFSGEPIPTLAEVLALVDQAGTVFISDLRIPPADHPMAPSAFERYLEHLAALRAASRVWILAAPEQFPAIQAALPAATLAKSLDYAHAADPLEVRSTGYRLVNSEYGLSVRAIRAYQAQGLWVNLWTVDEPWQYSRLWLAGADSVTTNNLHRLAAMTRPVLVLSYPLYSLLWTLYAGLAGLALFHGRLAIGFRAR